MIKRIISIMLVLLLSFNIVYADVVMSGNSHPAPLQPPTQLVTKTIELCKNSCIIAFLIAIVIVSIVAAKKKSEDKDIKTQKIIFYVCIFATFAIYIIAEFLKWLYLQNV
jgi:hypothetical protein